MDPDAASAAAAGQVSGDFEAPISRMVERLEAARTALLTAGRLEALGLVGEAARAAKQARARRSWELFDAAMRLDEHLELFHGAGEDSVSWPQEMAPDRERFQRNGHVDLTSLDSAIAAWESRARLELRNAAALAASSPLFEGASRMVALLEPVLRGNATPARNEWLRGKKGARLAAHGPEKTPIDPVFKPTFSLLELNHDPTLTGLEIDRGPYYWCLALRELAAAELCALCLVEYDGLPAAYYRDFAKQMSDEIRHGMFFLEVGLSLLEGFVRDAPADHPLLAAARAHLETGSGLPVPLEGGLQLVSRDTSLEQRLVLMHLDTETPGIGAFHEQARSPWAQARPWIAEGIEATVHDEASHARIGRRWLEAIAPDREERAKVIEQARALRGFFIFSSLASSNKVSLPDLLGKIAAQA